MNWRLFPLLLVMACTCSPIDWPAPAPIDPTPTPPAPPMVVQPDAGAPEPIAPASCESACERQRAIPCPLGDPTPQGHSCEEVCLNAAAAPIVELRWNVTCLTEATTCAEARACR